MSTINITQLASPAGVTPRLFGAQVEVPAEVATQVSIDEVCDLIASAGPLTLADIAGGLAVPAGRAASCIRGMVKERALKQDEFGRYQLAGACAMR